MGKEYKYAVFILIFFLFFQARRLITLHKPRRNTLSNEQNCMPCAEAIRKSPEIKQYSSSSKSLHNSQKNFDEDGYLSPLEIKAKVSNIFDSVRRSISSCRLI